MRRVALLAVGTALLLTGCASAAREPDQIALVRVLGVDGGREVTLTAVCGGDDQGNASRGSSTGADFQAALERLPWSGEREELSLTSVSYLIVGPEADLEEVLLEVLNDPELGASATVWAAEEGARALLESWEDPSSALRLLTERGAAAPTAAQALAALSNEGWVALPRLLIAEDTPRWDGTVKWEAVS